MATNNFKPFATGSSANVTTQADYEVLPSLQTGFQSGKASSAQINKAIRQASSMAAVLGQFIANSGADALDNGDISTMVTNLIAAIKANLSLKNAAYKDVGNGANQIPDMSLFASFLSSGNGYQKMPGGLIIQFGGATTDSTGKIDLTLPLVYPQATYRVVACAKGSTADNAAVSTRTNHAGGFSAFTTKSASGSPNVAGSLAFEWITVGF